MTAVIKDGNLIVTIPMYAKPQPSATGKTLVVASSRGNRPTSLQVAGREVTIGVNAYIDNAGGGAPAGNGTGSK